MFTFKKYYYGIQIKKYDSSKKDSFLKDVFLSDFNKYTQKDFLMLKQIYNENKLDDVLKQIQTLKYNQNKISVPFLESLFYSKYNLELLPYDLKIKNILDSISEKLNDNYKIKEFAILYKSKDTFDLNLLFLFTYNKKGKVNCEFIYQDYSTDTINNLKNFLDYIWENNSSYFLKYFYDVNLYQDNVIGNFLLNNKKDPTNYFVNKFPYDFDSPYFRQIHHNYLYKDKTLYEDDEFDFDEFDEYFDSEFDELFETDIDKTNISINNCYEIFGLTKDASISEIKRAYRSKARMYHPDVNKTKDGEKKFKEINLF